MITLWQFAAICVVAFILLALILVITIREYDESVAIGNEEDERDESARYAPQWQPDRDTDEYSSPFALGDIHPESISEFVERITAEETAKREALRAGDETSGATQRAGHVTPRISMSGSSPDNGTIPRRSARGNRP